MLYVCIGDFHKRKSNNFLVHEMAHAWHTMLDLDNVEMIENYQRVNKSRIYENVPYINGVIAPKTYGLQVMLLEE